MIWGYHYFRKHPYSPSETNWDRSIVFRNRPPVLRILCLTHRRVYPGSQNKKDKPSEPRAFKDIQTAKSWPAVSCDILLFSFSEDGCFLDKSKTVSVFLCNHIHLFSSGCMFASASQTSCWQNNRWGVVQGILVGRPNPLRSLSFFQCFTPLDFWPIESNLMASNQDLKWY